MLPFGATEPHNLHMPYGTDNFQVEEIGRRACEHAYEAGAQGAAAADHAVRRQHQPPEGPRRPGVQRDADDAAGASSPTWSIRWSGRACKKLVLLNGHGGNELKPLTRELHHRTDVFLCVCDWYRMAADLYPRSSRSPASTPTRWRRAWAWRSSRTCCSRSWPTTGRRSRRASRRSTAAGSASRGRGTW